MSTNKEKLERIADSMDRTSEALRSLMLDMLQNLLPETQKSFDHRFYLEPNAHSRERMATERLRQTRQRVALGLFSGTLEIGTLIAGITLGVTDIIDEKAAIGMSVGGTIFGSSTALGLRNDLRRLTRTSNLRKQNSVTH